MSKIYVFSVIIFLRKSGNFSLTNPTALHPSTYIAEKIALSMLLYFAAISIIRCGIFNCSGIEKVSRYSYALDNVTIGIRKGTGIPKMCLTTSEAQVIHRLL